MKKNICFYLVVLLCMAACVDNNSFDSEYPNAPSDYSEFGGYFVKDTVGFDKESIRISFFNDSIWIWGLKNEKLWIGLFDANSKQQKSAWISKTSFAFNEQLSISNSPVKLLDGFVLFLDYRNEVNNYNVFPLLLMEDKVLALTPFEESWSSHVSDLGNKVYDWQSKIYIKEDNYARLYTRDGKEYADSVSLSASNDKPFVWGFHEKKIWIGVFNDNATQLNEEFVSNEIYNRHKKIYQGYGEYLDYYIGYLWLDQCVHREWGYTFVSFTTDISDYYIHDVFLCKDGTIKRLDCQMSPLDWFNGSLLVYTSDNRSRTFTVYSPEAEALVTIENKDAYYEPLFMGSYEPINYTEYIQYQNNGLMLTRYKLDGTSLWTSSVKANIASNAKCKQTITKFGEIWQHKIDVVNYDGSTEQIKFSVNIRTGEISETE